jgi:hypothetical protein
MSLSQGWSSELFARWVDHEDVLDTVEVAPLDPWASVDFRWLSPAACTEAFFKKVTALANDWTLPNLPKTKESWKDVLMNDDTNTFDIVSEEFTSTDGRRSFKPSIKDGTRVLVVKYDWENIWLFMDNSEWHRQVVAFMLNLYEFIHNWSRQDIIAAAQKELDSLKVIIDLRVQQDAIYNYRVSSSSASAIQQDTKDIVKSTRQANKENDAQRDNNDARMKSLLAWLRSAALELGKTQLVWMKSLINDYILMCEQLQQAFAEHALTVDNYSTKMQEAKDEFLGLLVVHLQQRTYSEKELTKINAILRSLWISRSDVNKAKRAARGRGS